MKSSCLALTTSLFSFFITIASASAAIDSDPFTATGESVFRGACWAYGDLCPDAEKEMKKFAADQCGPQREATQLTATEFDDSRSVPCVSTCTATAEFRCLEK